MKKFLLLAVCLLSFSSFAISEYELESFIADEVDRVSEVEKTWYRYQAADLKTRRSCIELGFAPVKECEQTYQMQLDQSTIDLYKGDLSALYHRRKLLGKIIFKNDLSDLKTSLEFLDRELRLLSSRMIDSLESRGVDLLRVESFPAKKLNDALNLGNKELWYNSDIKSALVAEYYDDIILGLRQMQSEVDNSVNVFKQAKLNKYRDRKTCMVEMYYDSNKEKICDDRIEGNLHILSNKAISAIKYVMKTSFPRFQNKTLKSMTAYIAPLDTARGTMASEKLSEIYAIEKELKNLSSIAN